jgi:hypothetical protein
MKPFLLLLAMVMAAGADVYVQGYRRADGTVVRPHWRTNPDGNPFNNYSSPVPPLPEGGTFQPDLPLPMTPPAAESRVLPMEPGRGPRAEGREAAGWVALALLSAAGLAAYAKWSSRIPSPSSPLKS